jgi:hypothetical protein
MAGKAKAIGVSNYSARHLQELLDKASVKPVVNQVSSSITNVVNQVSSLITNVVNQVSSSITNVVNQVSSSITNAAGEPETASTASCSSPQCTSGHECSDDQGSTRVQPDQGLTRVQLNQGSTQPGCNHCRLRKNASSSCGHLTAADKAPAPICTLSHSHPHSLSLTLIGPAKKCDACDSCQCLYPIYKKCEVKVVSMPTSVLATGPADWAWLGLIVSGGGPSPTP